MMYFFPPLPPTTEVGKINTLVGSVDTSSTPIIDDLETFGAWLAGITVVVAVVTFVIAYVARGIPLGEAFGNAVGVAVAIIPEVSRQRCAGCSLCGAGEQYSEWEKVDGD